MKNINTKKYWESRFKSSSWGKKGIQQTREYAISNVTQMGVNEDFTGSILDFGCAFGDAIPIYCATFPNATFSGIDISKNAIKQCKNKYGNIAKFKTVNDGAIKNHDLIIASHVLEHITDDKSTVKMLLSKCKELFIFVPYKETPLYHEHVNYYQENYYDSFNVLKKNSFLVSYKQSLSFNEIIKNLLKGKVISKKLFSKEIIMFHIKGQL
tara:strand:- start:1104 stop:1736 length:633 start_codon:yes stop_codon:yes gene_type:complete